MKELYLNGVRIIKQQHLALRRYYNERYLAEHQGYSSGGRSAREAAQIIRWLGRKPTSICDVACGNGRHLSSFADLGVRRGFGFDQANTLVRTAKVQLKRASGYHVEHLSFDQWKPAAGQYDLACCLFSSFNYCLTDTAAERLLGKMLRATKRGGLVCVDLDNPFRLVRFLSSRPRKEWRGCAFDASAMVLLAREHYGRRVLVSDTRYFVATELYAMLSRLGIKGRQVRLRGGFDDKPYSWQSQRLILLVRKRK